MRNYIQISKWTRNANYLCLKWNHGLLELFCLLSWFSQKFCIFMECFIQKAARLKIENKKTYIYIIHINYSCQSAEFQYFRSFQRLPNITCELTSDLKVAPRIPAATCKNRMRSKPIKNWKTRQGCTILRGASNCQQHHSVMWPWQPEVSASVSLYGTVVLEWNYKYTLLLPRNNCQKKKNQGKYLQLNLVGKTIVNSLILKGSRFESLEDFMFLHSCLSQGEHTHTRTSTLTRVLKAALQTVSSLWEPCGTLFPVLILNSSWRMDPRYQSAFKTSFSRN